MIKILSGKMESSSVYKGIYRSRHLYLMFLPVLLYFLVFKYGPMFGLVMAFERYNPIKGFFGSEWVGLKYFEQFMNSIFFWRVIRNTLMIFLYDIVFAFPAPIILALLLNEVRNTKFKRTIQTITYIPHFISTVVVASMVVQFLSPNTGAVNNIIALFGGEKVAFLNEPGYFRAIYTLQNIWREIGWNSILYFAAITQINSELYEAAIVDGAGRWRQLIHVTLPGISSVIIILFLMKIGRMLNFGFDSILLLYNTLTYDTADVIQTFIYRRGILENEYGFSAAVGLFQSTIGFIMVTIANKLSGKYSETSLW